MAVHDLRQKTKASTGQRIIKDESSCNCSEKIVELQQELQQLKNMIQNKKPMIVDALVVEDEKRT
jgi:hypothetical protein|tara:strand:+ start:2233 stop:2427 length:195 start_codon:yes stop_codon:yes gene_type:complete